MSNTVPPTRPWNGIRSPANDKVSNPRKSLSLTNRSPKTRIGIQLDMGLASHFERSDPTDTTN